MYVPQSAVSAFLKIARANRAYLNPQVALQRIAKRALRPQRIVPRFFPGQDKVKVKVANAVGMRIYVLEPRTRPVEGAFIYVHGGGWVNQITVQHWQLCAQIAHHTGRAAIMPIYPLIPFGTADKVVPAIAKIVAAAKEKFGSAALGGDSAGGQIALSAALETQSHPQKNTPETAKPDQLILISPALDATFSNPRIAEAQKHDPWLGVPGCQVFLKKWAGPLALTDPKVSPLLAPAKALARLGRVTIFTGTADIFNPDAHALAHKIALEGGRYNLVEEPGGLHVYPLLPTRAGAAARTEICALLT
ncbi:hydrolase, alpha/beta domain protein [Winkia neuii]|nr:hydrolase, alpha/beta domain protein [Winkia neuii]